MKSLGINSQCYLKDKKQVTIEDILACQCALKGLEKSVEVDCTVHSSRYYTAGAERDELESSHFIFDCVQLNIKLSSDENSSLLES